MEFQIQQRGNYIHLTLKGVFDIVQMKEGFHLVMEASKELNLQKILLDIRLLTDVSLTFDKHERFFFLREVLNHHHDELLKFVLLVNKGLISIDQFDEKLKEMLRFNLKSTENIDVAVEWLEVSV